MPVDAGFVGQRADHVHTVEVVDETVVLHEPSGKLHVLNATGALVWDMLDGRRDVAALARVIADQAGVDETTVTADLIDLLALLVDEDLVTSARD